MEVLPDSGQVGDDRDAELAQLVGGPDAGQQQELRGLDRACRHDDLTPGTDLALAAGRRVLYAGARPALD